MSQPNPPPPFSFSPSSSQEHKTMSQPNPRPPFSFSPSFSQEHKTMSQPNPRPPFSFSPSFSQEHKTMSQPNPRPPFSFPQELEHKTMSQPNPRPPFSFSPSSSQELEHKTMSQPNPPPPFSFSLSSSQEQKTMSQPNPPPPFSFSLSSSQAEKGCEDDNSVKAPHHDEIPETVKTRFTNLSAVTGVIPCHFEGTAYSFKIHSPTCSSAEESSQSTTEESSQSTKKEMNKEPELNSSATQIVIVSRILKGIPQNPHFMPLKTYSSVAKQRLINSWDNIFEETVNKLLNIQVAGFLADSRRLWETMEELEKMGYNILPLRRRLVDLTDVLASRRRHKSAILRLKNEAEKHRMEKTRLEFEIVKLRAKVEAENASVEDMMGKVAKMEEQMPFFNALFAYQAIKEF